MRRSPILLAVLAALLAAPAARAEVNLYTTREPALVQPLLDAFTKSTGVPVKTLFLQAGLAERVAAEGEASPADVLMAVDIGNLVDLTRRGVAQPLRSPVLEAAVPPAFRDPEGRWFALSLRARAIFVARDRVQEPPRTYEELADPRWRGKVCVRSGQHPYNTSLFAAYLAKHGEADTLAYLTAVKANLARRPGGGDREVARDILAGLCDVGLSNTYYYGVMLSGAGGDEQRRWGEAVRVVLPTFADKAGTHVNMSGAALARNAPNRADAVRLMEFLVSPEAQRMYADQNYEHPILPGMAPSPLVAGFGPLVADSLPLATVAENRPAASLLVDRAAFDR